MRSEGNKEGQHICLQDKIQDFFYPGLLKSSFSTLLFQQRKKASSRDHRILHFPFLIVNIQYQHIKANDHND